MTEDYPHEHEQLLHQIHADVFLERLRDYVDLDGDVPEKDATDLNNLTERLLVQDSSPSIDRKGIEKLLEDDEIRELLKQSICNLIKPQLSEESEQRPKAK